MKNKKVLAISVGLNILFALLFLSITYAFRDKLYQRFMTWKGQADIVMFGTSITAQGNWTELLGRTDVANSGLPGQTTHYFLPLIQSHVVDLKPKICFVEGGINDITVGVSQERVEDNYKIILETLKQHNIIPVVTLTVYEQNDPVSKKEVDLLNEFLVEYCKKHQIEFLDLNKSIADSTGLRTEYARDKTHLNRKAYEIWALEIKKILTRLAI